MNPVVVKILRVLLAVVLGCSLFFVGLFAGAKLFPEVREVVREVDNDDEQEGSSDTDSDDDTSEENNDDEVPDKDVFAKYTVTCGDLYTQGFDTVDYMNNDKETLELDTMASDLIIEARFAGQEVRSLMLCETNAPSNVISSEFYVYVACVESCIVPIGYGVGYMDSGDFEQAYYQTEYVLPYGICNSVVELNSNPHITIECMGGDGGFAAKELVQFDLSTNSGRSVHYEEETMDV